MKIRTGWALPSTVVLASIALLTGCTTTEAGTSTKHTNPDTFYADFKAPTVPPEAGVDERVDTTKFKKSNLNSLVIGYADSSLGNAWRVMAKADTEYGISKIKGAKLVYTNANDSSPKQIADMADLITKKVDAIILSATDVKALCPSIKKATDAGIPVIIQERMVDCDTYTTFASLDATANAVYQMQYVAQRLKGKGKIAIISGIPGIGHTVAVEAGYKSVLKQYPGIKVVATDYAEYDPTKARDDTAAILTAHPDVDAFASISGNMTSGVFQAVQDAGKVNQMKAWTGDDANGWMLIQKKYNLPAMTTPYPTTVGRAAVALALKVLEGKPVMKTVEVPKWANAVDFSEHIGKYANPNRPAEWTYTDLPCGPDPFCK